MVVTLEWVRDHYDINKSRYIEKNEKDSAFDDWGRNTISMSEFMNVSDAYDQHTLLPAYCPWDLNGDGYVNDDDLVIFQSASGSKAGDANWNPACDFNGNGEVDNDDFVEFSGHWGPCPTSGAQHAVSFIIPTGATIQVI